MTLNACTAKVGQSVCTFAFVSPNQQRQSTEDDSFPDWTVDRGLQITSPKGHWSDIYVECNDQVNVIT